MMNERQDLCALLPLRLKVSAFGGIDSCGGDFV